MEIILEVVFYNQLCFLHFYRNLKGKLTLKSTKQIYTLWKKIKEFLKYPEEIRRHIYTTNIVESINSGIELMRLKHGGYFHSYKILETNLFIQLSNLHDEWLC